MTTTTIRPLNDELRKIAREELNEVESRIPEDLALFKAWIEKQPHLKSRTDDQFLIAFLRGSKYSLEKAKSKLDHFYTIKTMMPEMFSNRRVDNECVDICRTGTYVRLRNPLGPGGPRIQMTNYSKFDPKTYTLNQLFRHQVYYFDMQIYEDDNCIISGYLEIIDLSKFSISFLTQLDFMLVKKLGVFMDKAAPMRLKGLHFINVPKEALVVLNFARTLLSKKLQQRFFLHKDLEELYKHVPKEYLPTEYGGTNGSIEKEQTETEKKFLKYQNYFVEDEQYGVDENLRPGKKINMDSLFGIEGSFRKLNID